MVDKFKNYSVPNINSVIKVESLEQLIKSFAIIIGVGDFYFGI